MNILHLISSGGMYGAEAMVLNLASAQRRLGHDVHLGVFDNLRHHHVEVAHEAEHLGIPTTLIPSGGRFDTAPFKTIRCLVAKERISLVHGHGYKADFYGYLTTRRAGIPFVATCHLWTGASLSVRIYECVDRLILRGAARVVGVSDAVAKTLQKSGIAAHRVSIIYNGVDFVQGSPEPALLNNLGGRLLIGTIARLEEQKGLEYFVRAARIVVNELNKAQFVIVGEGSLRSQIAGLIHRLKLEKHVLLVGERRDMSEVYASLDLVVLASVDEGMPMVLLEALSAGRPVVATRVGAVEKLIRTGETGLLVEPRDIGALAAAMLRLLKDPALAHSFAQNGQRLVRTSFSAEGMARQYLELYRELLEPTVEIPEVLTCGRQLSSHERSLLTRR